MNENDFSTADANSNEQERSSVLRTDTADAFTLFVRGGNPDDPDEKKRPTDPRGLSRSLLHVLQDNPDGYVKLKSVGPVAGDVVMRAFRLACEIAERGTKGIVLVVRQSEYTAIVGGKRAVGVCTRIFSIPIKHAV